jgi:hypothetical protein
MKDYVENSFQIPPNPPFLKGGIRDEPNKYFDIDSFWHSFGIWILTFEILFLI